MDQFLRESNNPLWHQEDYCNKRDAKRDFILRGRKSKQIRKANCDYHSNDRTQRRFYSADQQHKDQLDSRVRVKLVRIDVVLIVGPTRSGRTRVGPADHKGQDLVANRIDTCCSRERFVLADSRKSSPEGEPTKDSKHADTENEQRERKDKPISTRL